MRLEPRLLPLLVLLATSLHGCDGSANERRYLTAENPELPFSNGVLEGNTLHVAGHLGLDPGTGRAPTDPAKEAKLLLDAFAKTLARVDMDMNDLVMVQVYCSDVELYATFNKEYARRFDKPFPARAFIGSGKLLRDCRFEMLGRAVRK